MTKNKFHHEKGENKFLFTSPQHVGSKNRLNTALSVVDSTLCPDLWCSSDDCKPELAIF